MWLAFGWRATKTLDMWGRDGSFDYYTDYGPRRWGTSVPEFHAGRILFALDGTRPKSSWDPRTYVYPADKLRKKHLKLIDITNVNSHFRASGKRRIPRAIRFSWMAKKEFAWFVNLLLLYVWTSIVNYWTKSLITSVHHRPCMHALNEYDDVPVDWGLNRESMDCW